MKILGTDPGGTTGFCSILIDSLAGHRVLESFEVKDLWKVGMGYSRCDIVAVESIVAHGKLTQGKIDQIKAVAIIESRTRYRGHDTIKWITPEERGRVKKAPKIVVGTHAKDAYRVAVAYALKEGLMTKDEADALSTEG